MRPVHIEKMQTLTGLFLLAVLDNAACCIGISREQAPLSEIKEMPIFPIYHKTLT